jgi:xanthine dehydrogenase accessory factor
VTIVDDRQEYANPQRFPEAYRTLAVGFDASWEQLHITPSTSIVIVTRGHKFDERVLERAVHTPARYIGMIGSKRKVITTFDNLLGRGVPIELLRKVRAPMGLAIGALTAEEIGISITAELIAVRRGVESPGAPLVGRVREFFESEARPKGRAPTRENPYAG